MSNLALLYNKCHAKCIIYNVNIIDSTIESVRFIFLCDFYNDCCFAGNMSRLVRKICFTYFSSHNGTASGRTLSFGIPFYCLTIKVIALCMLSLNAAMGNSVKCCQSIVNLIGSDYRSPFWLFVSIFEASTTIFSFFFKFQGNLLQLLDNIWYT